jgi:hypothetical protein
VPLPQVAIGWPRCGGPTIRISGGSGLAGRAITTSAAGAVPAVVTAASTAIVVFVVILGPVATDAAVAPWGGRDNVEDGGLAAGDAMLV